MAVQGESYDEDLISSALQPAVPIIGVFIGPSTLKDLVAAIKALGLDNNEEHLQCLAIAESKMSLISQWFEFNVTDTFAEVMRTLTELMATGRCVLHVVCGGDGS
jgi:hypothetical protein